MKFYISSEKIKNKNFKSYIKFLIAGAPSALLAIPLNIILVEIGQLNKPISYSIVIFFQILMNFCFLKKYVFKNKKNESTIISFLKFFFGILIFRTFDWFVYIKITSVFPDIYIIIQVINITIFSMIKFKYSKLIFN